MRKFLLLMLTAATLLASCQKDADLEVTGAADDGMVDVTVSASMECASATTRAIASYGDGKTIDRCIMEVYIGSDLYKRMVTSKFTTGDSNTREVAFELRLVAGQTYDFLFWADKDDTDNDNDADDESYSGDTQVAVGGGDKHYITNNTNGLKAITTSYDNYEGSDETRDAFFGSILNKDITASIELPVTLTRPFGQLNISTYLTDVLVPMYPKTVKINYSTTVGDTFNVSNGVVGGSEKAIDWDVTKSIETSDVAVSGSTLMHLSTDYLFASENEQDIHNFSMTFYSDEAGQNEITTNDNFKNIPIQRNYRTNVSGELLTKQGTVTVTIDPEFDNEETEVGIYEVAKATDIATIIEKATTESVYIKVVQDLTGTNNASNTCYVYFADNEEVEDITLEFTNVSVDTNIYIGGDENYETTDTTSTTYNGTLNVITGDTDDEDIVTINSLYIYANLAHVTYTGKATTGNVETNDDTFVLVEDSSIGTLTVEGGNVKVYGTVGDETESNKGIIISATNKTTTSIEVYDGATVDKITPDESYTASSGAISITVYDGGEVTNLTDSDYIQYTFNGSVATIADLNTFLATAVGDVNVTLEESITGFGINIPLTDSKANSITIEIPNFTSSEFDWLMIGNDSYTGDLTIISPFDGYVSFYTDSANSVTYSGNSTNLTIRSGGDAIVTEDSVVGDMGAELGDFQIYGTITGNLSVHDDAGDVSIYGNVGTISTPTAGVTKSIMIDKDVAQPDMGTANKGTIIFSTIQNSTTNGLYSTPQAAVDAASAGDTIYIGAGEYTTGLTISKALTIQGPNAGVAGNSEDRVAEANFTTKDITFSSSDITLDGISIDGNTACPAMSFTNVYGSDIENITFKNMYVANIKGYFCRNTKDQGNITNLKVEDSKFYNIYSGSGEPFAFFIYELVSAEFKNNVFDEIDKHALNIMQSPDATSLVIRDNTFTNCTSVAIQLANLNAGKIDIYNNTINNCSTAFNIYAWKNIQLVTNGPIYDGKFAAQIDVYENTVSDVQTFASVGNADYVNSAGVPLPFADGAYVTFEDNTISLPHTDGEYEQILSDFYSYDGVVTFTNNDVSGGAVGVFDTWENILKRICAFWTYGHSCTQVNIDGVLYQPTSNGYYMTEVTE